MQKGYRTEAMVTMQQKSKAHRTGSGRWEVGGGSWERHHGGAGVEQRWLEDSNRPLRSSPQSAAAPHC